MSWRPVGKAGVCAGAESVEGRLFERDRHGASCLRHRLMDVYCVWHPPNPRGARAHTFPGLGTDETMFAGFLGAMHEEIIGRGVELEEVHGFLGRAATGPCALVIEGEPGIGKTTLWLQAVRAGESRGCRVLRPSPQRCCEGCRVACRGTPRPRQG